MATMNVEILSREKTKPSSPTPHDLKIHELSLLDQFAPTIYIPIILFYQAKDNHDIYQVEISSRLKESLEQALTSFSPFAGRVKEDHCIECNDDGVDYYEARVTCKLSEILKHFDLEILNQFLPFSYVGDEDKSGSPQVLLAIQYNYFDCGGVAIGACFSHRIADGASVTTLLNAWSTASRGDALEAVCPKFNGAMYFPPIDLPWGMTNVGLTEDKIVTRRLVFDESSIAALRDKAFSAAGSSVKLPTRVEAVSAFLWKHLMALAKSKQTRPVLSLGIHAVNLRHRMVPPMPKHFFGNLWYLSVASLSPEEADHVNDDGILVSKLSDAIRAIDDEYVKKLQSDEFLDCLLEML